MGAWGEGVGKGGNPPFQMDRTNARRERWKLNEVDKGRAAPSV